MTLITASAVLIAIGGSEAAAAPDGKTYTAIIAPSEATAGVLDTYALTVTNTSDSTPLGAVNLGTIPEIVSDGFGECSPEVVDPVFEFAGIPEEPVEFWAVGETKTWTVRWDKAADTIELRAVDSSDRLSTGESVSITFDLTVLQQSIASEDCVDYAFPIAAKQANTFAGEPGNDLLFVAVPGKSPIGPELRVWHVAQRCTTGAVENCTLTQGFGDDTGATFALFGTCDIPGDEGCGIIAIEFVSDGYLSTGRVIYAPAPDSTNVRAELTLPKDVLTKSPNRYTFDLYYLFDVYELDEDGEPILDEAGNPILVAAAGSLKEADLDKCRRNDTNCIEDIERTKTDVTWIFRVDPVDPRLDWN